MWFELEPIRGVLAQGVLDPHSLTAADCSVVRALGLLWGSFTSPNLSWVARDCLTFKTLP